MTLFCTFKNQSGMKIYSPVEVYKFSYRQSLDNINSGSILLSTELQTELKQNLKIGTKFSVELYEDFLPKTVIAQCLVTGISTVFEEGDMMIDISFQEASKILDNKTVGLRREFRDTTVSSVISTLLGEVGWTFTIEPAFGSKLITVRFDGQTYYGAIMSICEKIGAHLRLSNSVDEQIEIGLFGEDSGFNIVQAKSQDENSTTHIVETISLSQDLEQLSNILIPLGGGQGIAVLTIQDAPYQLAQYQVQSRVQGTETVYFIKDQNSIDEFGALERIINLSDISPVDNTDIGIERAKDLLYTASVEFLARNSQPILEYGISIAGVKRMPRIAQKIHLRYYGAVYDTLRTVVKEIDEDFWITSLSISYSNGLFDYSATLSSQDAIIKTTEKIVAGAIRDVMISNLSVQPYPTTYGFVYRREIDSTHSATVPINLTDGVLYIDRVLVNFATRPFRATASGAAAIAATVETTSTAAAVVGTSGSGGGTTQSSSSGGGTTQTSTGGGNHNHRMFLATSVVGFPSTSNSPFYSRDASGGGFIANIIQTPGGTSNTTDLWTESASDDHTHDITVPNHTHSVTIPDHTHSITVPAHSHDVTVPAHSHTLNYGIVDDVQTPVSIGVKINGVDKTVELGGPWAPLGGNIEQDIEISSILNNAIGELRQKHSVEFFCASGQGEVEISVEIKATVQSIQQV